MTTLTVTRMAIIAGKSPNGKKLPKGGATNSNYPKLLNQLTEIIFREPGQNLVRYFKCVQLRKGSDGVEELSRGVTFFLWRQAVVCQDWDKEWGKLNLFRVLKMKTCDWFQGTVTWRTAWVLFTPTKAIRASGTPKLPKLHLCFRS